MLGRLYFSVVVGGGRSRGSSGISRSPPEGWDFSSTRLEIEVVGQSVVNREAKIQAAYMVHWSQNP